MTPRDFCYWLQGYVEIVDPSGDNPSGLPLEAKQIACIRQHLDYVFKALSAPVPVNFNQQAQWDALAGVKVC